MRRSENGSKGRVVGARSAATICLAAVTVVAAGCSGGSGATNRSAAEAPADASSSYPTVEALFTKDVKWCFMNNGDQPVQIYFGNSSGFPQPYDMGGGSSGQGGPIELAQAKSACSRGSSAVGEDVEAEITFANGRKTGYAVYNPTIGQPSFFYNWQGSFTSGFDDYSEGQTRTYDQHYNLVTVNRLTDTDTKNFWIHFEGEIPPS